MSRNLILITVTLILFLPIAAYMYQFGIGFWIQSSEWAELGSYIGGVYTPILALLTLIVLCTQIYLQVIQHRQNLVSLQEAQLTEYLNELNFELDKSFTEDITVRSALLGLFNDKSIIAISEMDLSLAYELNQQHHKLYSMWSGCMACLEYIKTCSNLTGLQSAHYGIQKNKVTAYMGPQVCSSLDKLNYAMLSILDELQETEQASTREYEFWVDKHQA
ncbi:hypothetical protein ACSTKV_13865 [Vibrio parahaemolyticus]|nr:hypothetical protein [Vibrio parahaemolyticus]HCE3716105.1 hypothetical protein [Vibrio parahaemolyticus]